MSRSLSTECRNGFSLLELLFAMGILVTISVVLVSILSQTTHTILLGENDYQNNQRTRAILNFLRQDLRNAALPLDRSQQNSLQLRINPESASSVAYHDSVFWQAPVASDKSCGDLAEIGYYVYWNGTSCGLYRYFLNPSSLDYSATAPNDSLPGLTNDKYLFLENVAGLWIKAYTASGEAYGGDSRVSQTLPALVEIALVQLDSVHAQRLKSVPSYPGTTGTTAAAQAEAFVASLPSSVRPGASVVSMKVQIDNSRGW
ncbi:MAG: type II secretion system protein J [Chthoniobacteraceae bacterium]